MIWGKLIRKTTLGVWIILGGLFEWDPRWRERDLLVQLEGSREVRLTRAETLAQLPCETAIELISGLPGGGKSFYAVKLVLDELMHGHRPIVTNLPLKLARIQEYLDELGSQVNVYERVYMLKTPEEIRTFYLRRSVNLLLESPRWQQREGSKAFEWSSPVDWTVSQEDQEAAGGVFYVIDECHNWFHPEAFQDPKFTPEHPMFQWASQHRKLKDLCYFVTQSPENFHVAVRRLIQQSHFIRNYRKETFRGFRRGNGFMRTTYFKLPKTESAIPIEEKQFRLDVRGVGSCYYTAGGVGIAAKGVGDGGIQKKGFHMGWLWWIAGVSVISLAAVLFLVPRLVLAKTIDSTVGLARNGKAEKPAVKPAPTESVIASVLREQYTPVVDREQPARIPAADVPRVVGFLGSIELGRYKVLLSDGRVFTQADGVVTRATSDYVVISGVRYYMAKPSSGAGAKGAPEVDGRRAAVDAFSGQTGRKPAVTQDPRTPANINSVPVQPAQQPELGSWVTGSDGVSRLREPQTLGPSTGTRSTLTTLKVR